jgi:hypothetical protein
MAPKIIYQVPQQDNGKMFDREVLFKLEAYGLIKMMFLLFDVVPNGLTNYVLPTSPYIIQNVFLESSGNPIANLTSSYLMGRFEELERDNYDEIKEGASPIGAFNALTTLSLPLFFWTIDRQMLDPFKYPNLTIRATTKSTYQQMAFSIAPLSMNIRLKVIYEHMAPGMALYKPVELKNPYNAYRTTFPVGFPSTRTTVKLNTPFKACNLYFMIRPTENSILKSEIKSITLASPTGIIGTFENRNNYYIGKTNSANYGNVFAIQLGSRYSIEDDQYLQFNGQQNPMIATIEHQSTGAPSTLFVVHEYISNIVQKDGLLLEDITGYFVRHSLLSSLIPKPLSSLIPQGLECKVSQSFIVEI